ncbi:hypothetical protein HDU97_008158 [Phlyctochytrium planicorne]|nr:hypothetical protein HDU97_008158 [Phlyctochytrium planicorne]
MQINALIFIAMAALQVSGAPAPKAAASAASSLDKSFATIKKGIAILEKGNLSGADPKKLLKALADVTDQVAIISDQTGLISKTKEVLADVNLAKKINAGLASVKAAAAKVESEINKFVDSSKASNFVADSSFVDSEGDEFFDAPESDFLGLPSPGEIFGDIKDAGQKAVDGVTNVGQEAIDAAANAAKQAQDAAAAAAEKAKQTAEAAANAAKSAAEAAAKKTADAAKAAAKKAQEEAAAAAKKAKEVAKQGVNTVKKGIQLVKGAGNKILASVTTPEAKKTAATVANISGEVANISGAIGTVLDVAALIPGVDEIALPAALIVNSVSVIADVVNQASLAVANDDITKIGGAVKSGGKGVVDGKKRVDTIKAKQAAKKPTPKLKRVGAGRIRV